MNTFGGVTGQMRVFYGLALATLISFVLYVGRGILIPLLTAGFLSFLIFNLKENFRRLPLIGKFLPNWFAYLLAFATIFSVIFGFETIIQSNIGQLVEAAPLYEDQFRILSKDIAKFVNGLNFLPADFLTDGIDELKTRAIGMIQPALRGVAGSAQAIVTNSVVIFLYTVFMLVERGRIFRKIARLSSSERAKSVVDETIGDIGLLVRQYLTVKTITNLITAAISFAIMFAVGVDFPGFWALLIFALNYIPMFGAISAITLPVVLALIQPDGGVQKMLLTLGLLVGAEQIMSSAIEPRIVGKSLNLSPLVILISLAVWGTLWGFAGFLLAVPMTVTVMIILTQFESTRGIAIMLSDNGEIAEIKHPPLRALSHSKRVSGPGNYWRRQALSQIRRP